MITQEMRENKNLIKYRVDNFDVMFENGDIETVVTVREDVLSTVPYDAVSADLTAGEEMTLGDLIGCMLVGSANDAAAVIAENLAGSQAAFVARMNLRAQELGCTGTQFTNVHGLHDKEQYTTARDIARILAKAVENEAFCDAFGAVYYTVEPTNKADVRYLSTENYMMNDDMDVNYYDTRVTGSRTGVNNDYTRNVASVAEVL